MKKDDLTQVKYIGASRKKSLNDLGITTIEQLYETPLDTLARIETIGAYYAKLIKDAVKESFGEVPAKTAPEETASAEDSRILRIKQDLIKQINTLKSRLKQRSEALKSSGKKRFKTLMKRLDGLDQKDIPLSKKAAKNIIKKAGALNAILKDAGKRPKKRKYKKLSRKLRSFSKTLKRTGY